MYTWLTCCALTCVDLNTHTRLDLCPISTPLKEDAWVKALSSHPDRAFARYICDGLRSDFRIGFNHASLLRSASSNMLSASTHPEVVSDYIDKEFRLGRMLGPFDFTHKLPSLHVHRFGVIPKATIPVNGGSLPTCLFRMGKVSTMVLTRLSVHCPTQR